MMTDPLADMLTRIRNANMIFKEEVEVPLSKMKRGIAHLLKEEGYIEDFQENEGGRVIRLKMRYGKGKKRFISGLKRVSKPGLRVYAKAGKIPQVLGGIGIAIISTPKGLVTDKQARKEKLGGEVICYIW